MSSHIILRNGNIIDGTGNPWFQADVEIREEKITKLSTNLKRTADKEIDAKGLVISPGFINIHSHSDMSLPFDPKLQSVIRQGITTEVVGNCGSSLAPISDERLEIFQRDLDIFTPPGETIDLTWQTFAEYLDTIEKGKCAANIVPLVGFGTVRIAGGPSYEDREPTADELQQMKLLVEEAMAAGAFGMSTGLIYTPQTYASTNEVIELAKIVGKYNGLYFSHIRGEGKTVIKAVQELIDIVEKSGCKGGQIAHHKINSPSIWGTSTETLRLMEEANKRGLNITCDQYPYNRGMTSLITLLPSWIHVGGLDNLLDQLQKPEIQERIKVEITEGHGEEEDWLGELGWNRIYISSVKTDQWKDIEGKNLAEITKIKNKEDGFSVLFDLILEEKGEVTMLIESMGEEDIQQIMKNRNTMIGTDGWAVSPTGILGYGVPHPRFYGTNPRVLGHYVREKGLMPIEEAIRKMTSFPAQKLGLFDRGLIREGMCADIVIFNPETVLDKGTFTDPHQFPEGIMHVIVNGTIVVENNRQTSELPGKVLRRPS